jgi:hypothetical protein
VTLQVTSIGEDRFIVERFTRHGGATQPQRSFIASVFWTGHNYAVEVPVRISALRSDDADFMHVGESRTFEGALSLLNGQNGFYA